MNANADCRVLVAEDERDALDVLVRMLRRRGYQVHGADSGIKAAEKLKGGLFHVVVSDLKMPDMSGMDLLRLVMKKSVETVFVMITGYGTSASVEEAKKLGAFDYMDKPFDIEDLIGTIELGRKQKRATTVVPLADGSVSEVVESPPVDEWLGSVWKEIRYLDLHPTLNAVVGLTRDAFGAQLSFEKMSPRSESRGAAKGESTASQDSEPRIPLYGGVYLALGSWGTLKETDQIRLVQFLRRVVFGKLIPLG